MAYILRDNYGQQIPLTDVLHLGSAANNQVILNDLQVAPIHATLWQNADGIFIRDENTTGGTYVNRARIQGIVALRVGDQLSIGGTVFTVAIGETPVPAPPQLAVEKKGSKGCWKWGLIGILGLMIICVVLAGGGYYILSTNPELQDLTSGIINLPTPVPELDANGKPIGPETLDSKDPALNTLYSTSFRHYNTSILDGYDNNNAPLKRVIIREIMQQSQPEWSSYEYKLEKKNEKVITENEYTLIKGKQYSPSSGGNGKCVVRDDTFAGKREVENWPSLFHQSSKGRVKRVETGVTVNGILTDRYELKFENVGTNSSIELKSGSLYRAREGGYLVSFEYTILIQPQGYGMNIGSSYSKDKPALLTFHDDFTYYPAGTLKVKVMEACAGQVQS